MEQISRVLKKISSQTITEQAKTVTEGSESKKDDAESKDLLL